MTIFGWIGVAFAVWVIGFMVAALVNGSWGN